MYYSDIEVIHLEGQLQSHACNDFSCVGPPVVLASYTWKWRQQPLYGWLLVP